MVFSGLDLKNAFKFSGVLDLRPKFKLSQMQKEWAY